MVDEFRTIRDNLFKVLTGKDRGDEVEPDFGDGGDNEGSGFAGLDASAAKALIAAVFARAGKGKDEVVQIIAREIGLAVAAMLKEPLAQLAKHQKLQISFEFTPKSGPAGSASPSPSESPAGEQETGTAPRRNRSGEHHPPRSHGRDQTKHSSRKRKSDMGG
jgi:hypothetical protein